MLKSLARLTCLGLAVASGSSNAGTVEQAFVLADPQMQVKDGAVQGCGYRLKSMPKAFEGLPAVVLMDVSFNLYSSTLGLLKGGALQAPMKNGTMGLASNRAIASFWLKAQGEEPTAPLQAVIPAESTGYLLYGVTPTSVMKLFYAVQDGSPITIGVRIKGEPIDRIYAGAAALSDADKAQGQQCMGDLVKSMKSELLKLENDEKGGNKR